MVMGGDSCSEGRVFKSHYRILDGHFFRPKMNEKGAGDGPFKKHFNVVRDRLWHSW